MLSEYSEVSRSLGSDVFKTPSVVVLSQQLQTVLVTTMQLRTSLANTMSCSLHWNLATLIMCVVNTSWAFPPIPSSGGNNREQMPTVLSHPMDMLPIMANFNTSMEFTMFLSALLWLYTAYHSWIYLHRQETASPVVDYIIACGGVFNYGCNMSTPPVICLVQRNYLAPRTVSSGTYFVNDTNSVSVSCWSVIPTPEDVCTRSSQEGINGAVTTTEATNMDL